MEGHEDNPAVGHPGNAGLHLDAASAGNEMNVTAIGDIHVFGVFGIDLCQRFRIQPIQGTAFSGHRSGVIMLMNTAGGEQCWIFGIRQLGGCTIFYGIKSAFSFGEGFGMQYRRAGMISRRAWPDQPCLFEPTVSDSAIARRQLIDFRHNL